MKFQRRQLLQAFASLPVIHFLSGCSPKDDSSQPTVQTKNTKEILPTAGMKTGFLSIIQGPTTDQQTLINIFSPRLKNYTYEVTDELGQKQTLEKYETVKGPFFYNIDKIKVSGLNPQTNYKLQILDISLTSGSRSVVDERSFKSLDLSKANPEFAFVSCMADDYRFNDVIDPMWNRLKAENVDFIAITGDVVYVDDKNLVERQKATEMDIWQRYVDTFKRIPLYHWYNLKPIFATWDDHDFGTNDGDKNFIGKEAATKIFKGAFFGPELTSGNTSWTMGPGGTSSLLTAFGQKFFFMDDRSFRQPNKESAVTSQPYGHWGESQHRWLIDNLKQDSTPAWIINGNQFFNGAKKTFIESLEQNHPVEFKTFVDELKTISAPVVFASGDVHLSEIMKISKDVIGFDSYEFTSSSMHSYLGDGWVNPLRVNGAYALDFNFMVFKSNVNNGGFNINTKCLGLPKESFFDMNFEISR
jgi:phosphodiesterase/alkaline phosphatase D-like protein